jgi:hypothetical protein
MTEDRMVIMPPHSTKKFLWALLIVTLLTPAILWAATIDYDLTIARQQLNITGEPAWAMTINGALPGPTLRFSEGDLARIRVHNAMPEETSIHWHGILVPPDMDGVPLLSFPPIAPGSTFTYEFPLRQSGTYWYHSHSGMQEQSGIYGAIVIPPREPEEYQVDREEVILFSDWTNEDPHEVMRTLKRGSERFALEKGSAQSLIGAARLGQLGAFFERERQRMPAMDIADVAYDYFLANGAPEIALIAAPGETLRLRLINGSSTSYFFLEFSGGPLRIISADGQPVETIEEQRLLIAVAETYDVLITVPADGAYELRATAHDGSGYASVWIGTGEPHPAPPVPRPNLYAGMGEVSLRQLFALTPEGSMGMSDQAVAAGRFDRPGMAMDHSGTMDMDHATMPMDHDGEKDHDADMAHAGHNMPETAAPVAAPVALPRRDGRGHRADFRPLGGDVAMAGDLALDGMDAKRPWSPYSRLRAQRPTDLPVDRPLREIRLTLDGDMSRYVWSFNNTHLSESDDILIRAGETVRFIMINRTMMHHPLHLHGHFFRVINGQEGHAPRKHTVDVPPMATTVIEFAANEVGDWFFHCHLLYHMESGMARVIHYEDFALAPELAPLRPRLYHDPWYFWGEADVLSNMNTGFLTTANIRNNFTAAWETGWQQVEGTDWEIHLTWERYYHRFFSLFAGAEFGNTIEQDRAVAGIHYLLPLHLETSALIGSDGEGRVEMSRSFQLLPRLSLDGRIQYDTDTLWEYTAGLSYTLSKTLSLRSEWHSDYHWGGGLQVRF